MADQRGEQERKTPAPFEMSEGFSDTVVGSSDAAIEWQPGQVIAGQFEVVRLLGRGGMGAVYEVNDQLTKQRLALKTILPSILSKPHAVDRFIQEANTARRLRHPGIVAVYDVRQERNLLFLTMEYLKGKSLRQIMNEMGKLPLEWTVALLTRVCVALEYAHKFMVHRDLSPENIMVVEDGSVRLLDFGIAKTLEPSTFTATHAVMGKAYYIAPEQRRDAASVDPRADIYSLGVIFFEMLAGEMPMGYNRLTALVPGLPHECDAVVERTLAPLGSRYETAGALRQGLAVCVATGRGKVERPPDRVTEPKPGAVQTFAGIEMVWIPPGEFMMGSPQMEKGRYPNEGPQHRVVFTQGFWLGKYAVTQQQWKQITRDNPSSFRGDDLPVEQVSWNDCQAFIEALNDTEPGRPFRLPSEAEWEYACRAGSSTRFHFGNEDTALDRYAWHDRNSGGKTHPVGGKKPNAWGLYDMHGNVWEWCKDWYHNSYSGAPTDGSAWELPIGQYRVMRGGSWFYDSGNCRAANRGNDAPDARGSGVGFRVARRL